MSKDGVECGANYRTNAYDQPPSQAAAVSCGIPLKSDIPLYWIELSSSLDLGSMLNLDEQPNCSANAPSMDQSLIREASIALLSQ
jgi:hypothetical protein